MDNFTRDDLRTLLGHGQTPCISLLMTTVRLARRQENETRWKDLLRDTEKRLQAAGQRAPDARALLQPAQDLLANSPFWQGMGNGLAAFLAPGLWRTYCLPQVLRDRVLVADHFDLHPLVPLFTGEDAYHALLVTARDVYLFEGTHEQWREIDLRAEGAPLRGVDLNTDTTREGTLKFYERVNRHLAPLFERTTRALVLAGPMEQRAHYGRGEQGLGRGNDESERPGNLLELYRQANTYAGLIERSYPCDPNVVTPKQVHDGSWEALQQETRDAEQRVLGIYGQLHSKDQTVDDLAGVLSAAYQGQLQYLLMARGQQHWGRFDRKNLQVEVHEHEEPGDEELLSLAVVYTLTRKGRVYALDAAEMPGHGATAGIPWLPGFGERTDQRVMGETTAAR